MTDRWADADAYEAFMGRWSRQLARTFVQWLGVPSESHWLEIGCGTGSLTARICELSHPTSVVATDLSNAFLGHARVRVPDSRVQFIAVGLSDVPARPNGYDAVVSLLVLNFLPDPAAALGTMKSLSAEGGIVGACVWDYSDGMQMLRHFWDAAVELDPLARELDEGVRFPICSGSALHAAFGEAGLSSAEVEPIEIATDFESFDDYWAPFMTGVGPAPGYLASLPSERQEELADRLRSRLPRRRDGRIHLSAKAWAARGQRNSDG